MYQNTCNTPSNRDNVFRNKWATIAKDAKIKLTQLILDDLNSKYQNVKLKIQSNLADLQNLTRNQFVEISNSSQTEDWIRKLQGDLNKASLQTSTSVKTTTQQT